MWDKKVLIPYLSLPSIFDFLPDLISLLDFNAFPPPEYCVYFIELIYLKKS